MASTTDSFHIGIIGSGPVGLECGLQALRSGYQFTILEAGDDIATHVRLWSHVALFTPMHMNMSTLGKDLLGHESNGEELLTGDQYIERYLRPVSRALQPNIRLRHRVVSIGRYRASGFAVLVENKHKDQEEYFLFDCVLDASGTYGQPNFVGPGYLPAINERALRRQSPSLITHLIPNLKYEQLAGKRIVLIGKGFSAATSAVYLAEIKRTFPQTELFWIIKQSVNESPYCIDPDDPLEQRRLLADSANRLYADPHIFSAVHTNTVVTGLRCSTSKLDVNLDNGSAWTLTGVDYIVANVGSQPDRSLYANLNVHECYVTKGPMGIAAKLVSSGHGDCLKQQSHGSDSLLTTEENFFILGSKSYGKQANFVLRVGFEQVSDVFRLINKQRHRTLR